MSLYTVKFRKISEVLSISSGVSPDQNKNKFVVMKCRLILQTQLSAVFEPEAEVWWMRG